MQKKNELATFMRLIGTEYYVYPKMFFLLCF